ncbi:AraC family transcriptional regulator [Halotalea alkalilenta]|nr:AraC family transcriptional regulator [Halotalea alkalilenta]
MGCLPTEHDPEALPVRVFKYRSLESGLVALMMKPKFSDLMNVIERHARYDYLTPIDGLKVGRTDQPSEVSHSIYQPSFGLVARGVKELMVGETPFRYAAAESLLCAADVPVTSQVTEASPSAPYLAIHLDIDPAVVAELLRERSGHRPKADDTLIAGKYPLDPELFDPLIRLLSLLERPRDIPVMAPLIRREIIWKLLHTEHGPLLSQLAFANGHATRIGRTTAWIREHYAAALSIPELAAKANMSVPSFHRHFKAVTSMSPVQFQKRVRLQEARRYLSGADTISSVAYDVGYGSVSQFNRDYRRLFNLTPSDDAAALRATLKRELGNVRQSAASN